VETPAKIRLLLFTDSFIHGGTERQFVQTLRCLDRQRFEISIGCLKRRGPFLTEIEPLQIPIYEFPTPSLYGWSAWGHQRALTRFLREKKIDILHAFEFYSNAFAVPAARLAGVPVVLASRREIAGDRSWPQRMAIRAACAMAHGVVANSRAAGSWLTGLWGESPQKVSVIPNAIDLPRFHPKKTREAVRSELGMDADAVLIGTVAALRPEKQLDTFIRAAAETRTMAPHARFLIAGEGNERPRLEALLEQLHLRDVFRLLGDRNDVADLVNAFDVFVLSSLTESFPNAILEAMALGKPVVSTRVGGTGEVVEEAVSGFLVPVGDAQAMATRIAELAGDSALRAKMGAQARTRVEREFTPARLAARLSDVYEKHLRERNGRPRILQIGNYPPPVCGWAMHTQVLDRELKKRGVDARVMDIGPGRTATGRDCVPVFGPLDYCWKLLKHRLRGFTFHMHVNGDSWKGYAMAIGAVLLGRLTGKPAVLTFHAGPVQMYFPRQNGFWHAAFKLLFRSCGAVICNHEPVKKLICETYGVPESRVFPIPALSTQYSEDLPVPLAPAVEAFLQKHSPRLFSYSLFRPEFTMEALFDSYRAIREQHPNAGLLIAGPKETPDEAAEQMRQRGIAGSILIPGNLAHAEFLTAVQRSDVFIRTHLRDGVCTSVLEALQLGVPVVASEDGLRPPSVVKFAPGDAADLTAKTLAVLGDLEAARRNVQAPEVHDHLEDEMAVLLSMGGAALPAPRGHEARG